ncbi:MAG: hypothetical protein ACRDRW_20400 [Pseudonocardiaceae bacterium]
MASAGTVNRVRYGNVTLRIFIALLTTGLTYLITTTTLSDQPQAWVSTVSVLIGGFTLFAQLLHGFDKRLERVEEKQEVHSAEVRSLIQEGFAKTSEVTELFHALETSALQTDTVTQLVHHATQIKPGSPALVYRFAQSEISRISQFLKELSEGGEVSYDGEDHDWMMDLTRQARHTIDATSMSSVDAGGISFEDGMWTTDFGQRYLDTQREAMLRGVVIRRVFILDSSGQTGEPEFLRIYRQHQDLGIHTRVLDRSTIPLDLKHLLFDFIVFDGVLSYEAIPAARVEEDMRPTIVKTILELRAQRVRERIQRFEKLWVAAKEFD